MTIILRISHDGSFKDLNNPSMKIQNITDIEPAFFEELKTGNFSVKNIEKLGFKNITNIEMMLFQKSDKSYAGQFKIYSK